MNIIRRKGALTMRFFSCAILLDAAWIHLQSCDHSFCAASNVLAFYLGWGVFEGLSGLIESNFPAGSIKERSVD
jgi:hypothetical protein